jgi:2-dehydro-3-deoxygluconokinase
MQQRSWDQRPVGRGADADAGPTAVSGDDGVPQARLSVEKAAHTAAPERTVTTVTSIDPGRPWDLLTLGETLALLRPPGVGALRHAHELQLSVGGAESNVAIGLARLDRRARWVGRVGDDELGARVLRELRAEGVAVCEVVHGEAPTGLMIKEQRTADLLRVSYYRRHSAGSTLAPADLPADWAVETAILHVTGITAGISATASSAVHAAVEAARAGGALVSLDLNYRRALWPPEEFGRAMRELLAGVDLVFGSPQEVAHVVGACGGSAERQLEALVRLGPAEAVLKLGEDGAVALVDGRLHRQRAYEVAVIDTVGAGDAFVAGWLSALLDEPGDVASRLCTAAACGAYACTVAGDWEGAPTREDVERLVQADGESTYR